MLFVTCNARKEGPLRFKLGAIQQDIIRRLKLRSTSSVNARELAYPLKDTGSLELWDYMSVIQRDTCLKFQKPELFCMLARHDKTSGVNQTMMKKL